jgi:uroporphyrinogen-III synthase
MSLKDKCIVVTRAPHQAEYMMNALRARGAIPLFYPTIDIAPPEEINPLDSALRNVHAYDWLVITSTNAVLAMRRRFGAMQIKPEFAHIKIAAVGNKSAEAVEHILGADVSLIPDTYTGETLARQMALQQGDRVLIPQSEIANPELADILSQRGADVTAVTAYRNVTGQGGEDIPEMIAKDEIDAITFTSSSTVENFVERIAPQTATHLPVACIGSKTADTAWEYDFRIVIVPKVYTLDSMLDRLEDHFRS